MVSSLSLACHVTPRFDHWYLACFERCLAGSEAVDAVDGWDVPPHTWWPCFVILSAFPCRILTPHCLGSLAGMISFLKTFSRMRSKGSRFTRGVWGLRVCLLDARNRLQPSAAVRNRSQPSATVHVRTVWPCLWWLLQKWSLWRFQSSRSLVSRGRRGTLWHSNSSNMFHKVLNVVLRGRRHTFASFSEGGFHFSWHVQHFGLVHVHVCVAGAAL